jgi:hypothetical protein
MTFNLFRSISGHIDLARIIGAKAAVVFPAPYLWVAFKHGTVPDPAAFGTGYLAVLGGIGAMIGGKEMAVAKAKETTAKAAVVTAGIPTTSEAD